MANENMWDNFQANPYAATINDWSASMAQSRDAAIAAMLARQQAAAASAQVLTPRKNISPEILRAALSTPDYSALVAPQQNPGIMSQIWRGLGRGVDNLQATGYGLVGLLGDTFGAEGVRDWGYAGAQAQQDEIIANGAQRLVPSIQDINSVGDFGTWALETLTDNLPQMAIPFGVAGLGAKTALGLVGKGAMEGIAARAAAQAVAKGMTKDAAAKFGAAQAASLMAKRGAAAGLYGSMGGMEAGQAWLADVDQNGMGNTNPLGAYAVGAANAALERFGVESSVLRKFLNKVPATQQAAVKKGILAGLGRAGKRGLISAGKEGWTEASQEITQTINKNRGVDFSPEDVQGIVEAAAAGGLFGAVMSPLDRNRRGAQAQAEAASPHAYSTQPWWANQGSGLTPQGIDPNDPLAAMRGGYATAGGAQASPLLQAGAGAMSSGIQPSNLNEPMGMRAQPATPPTVPTRNPFAAMRPPVTPEEAEAGLPSYAPEASSDFPETVDSFLQQQPQVFQNQGDFGVELDTFLRNPAEVKAYKESYLAAMRRGFSIPESKAQAERHVAITRRNAKANLNEPEALWGEPNTPPSVLGTNPFSHMRPSPAPVARPGDSAMGPSYFPNTPDSFLRNPNEGMPETTPFDETPDTFLDQQMGEVLASFDRSPDEFLQQPPTLQSPFEQTPDSFLQQPPAVRGREPYDPLDSFLSQPAQTIPPRAGFDTNIDNNFLGENREFPQARNKNTVSAYHDSLTNARSRHAKIQEDIKSRQGEEVRKVTNEINNLSRMNAMLSSNPASKLGVSEQQLPQMRAEAQKALIGKQAELTALTEKHKEETKAAKKDADETFKNIRKLIKQSQEATAQALSSTSPEALDQYQDIATQANEKAYQYANTLTDRLNEVKQEMARIRDLLIAGSLTPANTMLMRQKLNLGEKEQRNIVTKLRRLNTIANEINEKTTDPTKLYKSVSDAMVDLESLDAIVTTSNTIPTSSLASSMNAPLNKQLASELQELQRRAGKEPSRTNDPNEGKHPRTEDIDQGWTERKDIPNLQRRYRTKNLAERSLEGMSETIPGIQDYNTEAFEQSNAGYGTRFPNADLQGILARMQRPADMPPNRRKENRKARKEAAKEASNAALKAEMEDLKQRKELAKAAALDKEVESATGSDFRGVDLRKAALEIRQEEAAAKAVELVNEQQASPETEASSLFSPRQAKQNATFTKQLNEANAVTPPNSGQDSAQSRTARSMALADKPKVPASKKSATDLLDDFNASPDTSEELLYWRAKGADPTWPTDNLRNAILKPLNALVKKNPSFANKVKIRNTAPLDQPGALSTVEPNGTVMLHAIDIVTYARDNNVSVADAVKTAFTQATGVETPSLASVNKSIAKAADKPTAKPTKATPAQAKPQSAVAKLFAAALGAPNHKATQLEFDTVSKTVSAFTKKFKGLKDNVVINMNAPVAHATDLGFIRKDGLIVLNVNNIAAYAKQNKLSVAEVAEATLKHEGFGHYGLRTVLDSKSLDAFLGSVHNSFSNTAAWNDLANTREGFANFTPKRQAEEFCAFIAESADMSSLDGDTKSIWNKLKARVKEILESLGIVSPNKTFGGQTQNISEQDIITILRAGAINIAGGARIQAPITTEMGRGGQILDNTQPLSRTRQAEALSQESFFKRVLPAKDTLQDWNETLREGIVDSLRPVQRLIAEMKMASQELLGRSIIDVSTNLYKVLQALPNQTAYQLLKMHKQFVAPIDAAILKYAKTQPGKDNTVIYANVSDFLEKLAALERNKHGYKIGAKEPLSGISDKVCQETIRALDTPEMREISNAVQAMHQARLDLIVKYNLLGPDTAATVANWKQAYTHYMPFKSWEDIVATQDPNWYKGDTRRSISTPNAQKKLGVRATGRNTVAQDPLPHSIMQLYDVVHLVEKAKAQRSLIDLAKQAQQHEALEDSIRIVEIRTKDNSDTWTDLKRTINKDTGLIEYKKTSSTAEGQSPNVVTAIAADGSLVKIFVADPSVAKALKGENIMQAPAYIKAIGTLQHVMGKYLTSRNPLFWLTNPTRDALTAAVNIHALADELEKFGVTDVKSISKNIITKGLLSSFKPDSIRGGLKYFYQTGDASFTDKKGTFSPETKAYLSDITKFMEKGGQTTYFSGSQFEGINQDRIKMLNSTNPQTRAQATKALLSKWADYMDNTSDSLENMTRYIAFKEMVDSIKGALKPDGAGNYIKPDGTKTTENEIYSRAANMALNLTVNFTRKGAWSPVFNSLYMFASASIGGNVRMLETIFRRDANGKFNIGHAMKFATYPMAGYILQSTLARALMPDDDDGINTYDKIPEYVKSSSFIIPSPTGNGGYISIPIAYGYNVLWGMCGQLIDSAYAFATGKPGPSAGKAASTIVSSIMDNFSTLGQTSEGMSMFIPTLVRPLFQLATNKNFAGNPIMPEGNRYASGEVPDHQRYWGSANPSVVAFAERMYQAIGADVSPESIEHLSTAYLGGLGRIAAGLMGRADDLIRGKGLDASKFPGVGIFFKSVQDSETSAIFSTLRNQAHTQINNIDLMQKTPGMSTADRIQVMEENRQGYQVKHALNKTQTALNKLREQERMIDRSNLSMQEKTERLKLIKERKKQRMMQFNKIAIDAGFTDL